MPSRTYLFTVLSVALLSTAAVVLYFWDGSFNLIQSQICPKVSLWETQHITRIFRPIRSLESDNDPENNTFRSLLLPQNGGLLKVRMSNDSEKVNDYGISMFHQLHCLVVLREIIFPGSSTAHAEHDGRMARVHWAHCFDYLAQVGAVQICN